MKDRSKKYMNPYLAGFFMGLIILASFYLTREGVGASGAFKGIWVSVVESVAPAHAHNSPFYAGYLKSHPHPLQSRLVLLVLGVLAGGFISGALMGRLKLKIEHSPKITSKTRIIAAIIGGILFGFGASLGRGCTSGSALTGMVSLSVAGFVATAVIFGTGYVLAYFVRKLWI